MYRQKLNQKTVMIDRNLVPDYPPVQIFSEIKRKSGNAQSGFFLYLYIRININGTIFNIGIVYSNISKNLS